MSFQVVQDLLVDALAAEARGPKRNGVFAVWLFARVAEGLLPPHAVVARTHRRRLDALERRVSSLSVPVPLRRALKAGFALLAEGTPDAGAVALGQLVAPARETLGSAVADALGQAMRLARSAIKEQRQHERTPAHRTRVAH